MKNEKHYVKDPELWKQIRISQGKGKRTKRLEEMLILVSTNVFKRKINTTPVEDRADILSDTIMNVLVDWKTFNCSKYDTSLPYITEVSKRAQTRAFNEITRRIKNTDNGIPKFFKIDDLLGYDRYNKRQYDVKRNP